MHNICRSRRGSALVPALIEAADPEGGTAHVCLARRQRGQAFS